MPADLIDSVEGEPDILEDIRKWHKTASEAELENRTRAQESIDFRLGTQWDTDVLAKRAQWKLPSMVFNQCDTLISRVATNVISNLPFLTVFPEEENDLLAARSIHKIIKHIERVNDAETIYQNITENVLDGGFGYFRIRTEFSDYDTFDQRIIMEHIKNRFTVYFDPAATGDNYEDARYVIIEEVLERDDAEEQYGDINTDFNSDTMGVEFEKWFFDDKVRIAEVYYKEPITRTLLRLLAPSGKELVVFEDELSRLFKEPDDDTETNWRKVIELNGYQVIDEREHEGHRVMWVKVSGDEVLEGPTEIESDIIPVIKAVGKRVNNRGKDELYSLIENVKAPQKMLNYTLTTEIIMVSNQPKATWMAANDLVDGYEDVYRDSHHENVGLLMYKRNPAFPADKPELLPPPKSSQGYLNLVEFASRQIEDTSGVTDAFLGKKSNEVSGKAIQSRAAGSQMVNAVFGRNVLKAIAYGGKIMINMIGRIYKDTNKVIRVLGEADGFEYIKVNELVINPETGDIEILNDVSKNQYDYIVEASSNFKSKRRENVAVFTQMLQLSKDPLTAAFNMAQIARNMDIDNAEEIADKYMQLAGLGDAQGSAPNIEGNASVAERSEAAGTAIAT